MMLLRHPCLVRALAWEDLSKSCRFPWTLKTWWPMGQLGLLEAANHFDLPAVFSSPRSPTIAFAGRSLTVCRSSHGSDRADFLAVRAIAAVKKAMRATRIEDLLWPPR